MVKNKAQKWAFAALTEMSTAFPLPTLGIDSDSGSELINDQLLRWCRQQEITVMADPRVPKKIKTRLTPPTPHHEPGPDPPRDHQAR